MLYEKHIFVSPEDMMEAITATWGPGCTIDHFTIVDGVYHITGYRPITDNGSAKALWLLDLAEKTIAIHPLLAIKSGAMTTGGVT